MSSSDSIAASQEKYRFLKVIDSHTGGEPTRIIVEGGPDLGNGSMAERSKIFEAQFDEFRTASINEPRGSDVIVGGILCDPVDPQSTAGVVYFNNASYLGMCGHGTIGLIRTLQYMGRIDVGTHQLETPVGLVQAELDVDGFVSVTNVESYRHRANVCVEVPSIGTVCGDIAWGGNWFFLVRQPAMEIRYRSASKLQAIAAEIRKSINQQGFPQVDHVELFGPPDDGAAGKGWADSKNFVLCPGLEYDRSPCGTGTSAKIACLAADGKLSPGQVWTQQGVVGTRFKAWYEWAEQPVMAEQAFLAEQADSARPSVPQPDGGDRVIIPTIKASAFVTSDSLLLFDPRDPFVDGFDLD